ncbi:MAG: hypothetical protein U1F23_09490 [Lysobacterales bacterium]
MLSLLPFSVLLTRTFNAAAGSVLLPHLLHQSINSWGEALPFLLRRFAGQPGAAHDRRVDRAGPRWHGRLCFTWRCG